MWPHFTTVNKKSLSFKRRRFGTDAINDLQRTWSMQSGLYPPPFPTGCAKWLGLQPEQNSNVDAMPLPARVAPQGGKVAGNYTSYMSMYHEGGLAECAGCQEERQNQGFAALGGKLYCVGGQSKKVTSAPSYHSFSAAAGWQSRCRDGPQGAGIFLGGRSTFLYALSGCVCGVLVRAHTQIGV